MVPTSRSPGTQNSEPTPGPGSSLLGANTDRQQQRSFYQEEGVWEFNEGYNAPESS